MGFYITLCNVHTTQGQVHGTIVFYCTYPIPCPCPGPVQCVWTITVVSDSCHTERSMASSLWERKIHCTKCWTCKLDWPKAICLINADTITWSIGSYFSICPHSSTIAIWICFQYSHIESTMIYQSSGCSYSWGPCAYYYYILTKTLGT